MAKLTNEQYNQLRSAEIEHIKKSMQSDAGFKGQLTKIYNLAQEEIEKDIVRDIERFSDKEGVSMVEARKRIKKIDVENFSEKAKQYVEEKNFSDRANDELRLYNVTMRTNRLELLQAKLNLTTVALANEEEKFLQNHLSKEFIKEYTRQAGILGFTVPSSDRLNKTIRLITESSFQGATYSDRIWSNQADLREELNNTIRRTLLRGENPRKSSKDIRILVNEDFKNKKYAADRIAITESSRMQGEALKQSFEDGDVDQYEWVAEPDACEVCKRLDGRKFDVADMGNGSPSIPQHPFCRCSTTAYVDREMFEASLSARGL